MQSQARMGGLGGFISLDITALPVVLTAYGVPQSQWYWYLRKFVLLNRIAQKHLSPDK